MAEELSPEDLWDLALLDHGVPPSLIGKSGEWVIPDENVPPGHVFYDERDME